MTSDVAAAAATRTPQTGWFSGSWDYPSAVRRLEQEFRTIALAG
jgi:hypothetical protein